MRITTPVSISAVIIASIAVILALPLLSNAQTPDDHTAREEAAGQALWEQMQAQELACSDLSDEDFAALGEYFMGIMLGDAHEAMNARMTAMMGEEGEEQMHVVLGKRMSACEPDAQMPAGTDNWMPMMMGMGGGFMGGGINPMSSGFTGFNNNSMMGYGGFGGFGGALIMILFWVLIIIGIIALMRYVSGGNLTSGPSQSALDILKERYAKGEIDKDEFEAKKKDL